MLMLGKNPTLICAREVFQFLERKVEGILDHFEFFEHLQRIVNRNKIFWCLTMPKKEVFQTTYHMFVYVTFNEIAPGCSCNISRYVTL